MSAETRLNKYLAHAGVCSRREADRKIAEGRVAVNGRVVMELGEKIDPERDRVAVDGKPVRGAEERPVYILMNKPAGRVVSVKDPFGRPTVMELIGRLPVRVYPVGRLDIDTEGALLLTNDGDLALGLTHPRYGVGKTYEARVEGEPEDGDLDRVRGGIFLEGRRTSPARVRVLKRGRRWALLEVGIAEGRKREIRKLLEAVGFPVKHLKRVNFAGLTLEGLKTGEWRYLNKKEAGDLRKLVAKSPGPGPRPKERGHAPKGRVP
ncbi:MAG TPA: pseudouridine synthase [Candidatus Aminicenantes bacterium]|nr:pseudouridine synthase [Candidatus Aminicenantes bacterium]